MRHRTTPEFWEQFEKLTPEIQQQARRAFGHLTENPHHPGLHLKKVGRHWSARITREYRAIGMLDDEDFVWIWIGHHDEYERLIGRRG